MNIFLSAVMIVFMLLSCSGPPNIRKMDVERWKSDKNGCDSIRATYKEVIADAEDKIIGLSPTEVVEVFGNADKEELYKRNQKFFIYYMEPGSQCDTINNERNPLKFYIRFSALDRAKEISFRNY